MVYIGAVLGALIIILDKIQEHRKSFRLPVLAIAVGVYLPFELDSAIWVGGLIALLVSRYQMKRRDNKGSLFEESKKRSDHVGLLLASGLITGEALIGIILAIPVAITGRSDVLALFPTPLGSLPGLLVMMLVCWWVYKLTVKNFTAGDS